MFENSADFFGRIIVYSLDVLGEKASWLLMRQEMTWVQDAGQCGGTWETCLYHQHLMDWCDLAFFGADTLRIMWSHVTTDHQCICFVHIFFDQALCAWIMPFSMKCHSVWTQLYNFIQIKYCLQTLKVPYYLYFSCQTQVEYSHILKKIFLLPCLQLPKKNISSFSH